MKIVPFRSNLRVTSSKNVLTFSKPEFRSRVTTIGIIRNKFESIHGTNLKRHIEIYDYVNRWIDFERREGHTYTVESRKIDRSRTIIHPPTSTASERTSIFHHVDLEWPEGIPRIRRSIVLFEDSYVLSHILFFSSRIFLHTIDEFSEIDPLKRSSSGRSPGSMYLWSRERGIRCCPRRRGPFPFKRAKKYTRWNLNEVHYYPKASRRA